jgi:membrane-associated phospholipid phosphatase
MSHTPADREAVRTPDPTPTGTSGEGVVNGRRRTVLLGLGGGGLLSLLGVGHASARVLPVQSRDRHDRNRLTEAFQRRLTAARTHLRGDVALPEANSDDGLPGYYASFSKGLPHDATGEVDPRAYEALLAALAGDGEFAAIPLGGDRRLVNPEASLSFNTTGHDPHDVAMPPAPAFAGDETGAEMVELYWQALLRDVPLDSLGESPLAMAAATELSGLPGYAGPTAEDGSIPPELLFRGTLPGDDVGPHLSQFLFAPIPEGDTLTVEQRYRVLAEGGDYLTGYDEWLACQNGAAPTAAEVYADDRRYLTTGRDLATYVHRDAPYAAYLRGALILLGMGAPFDPANPLADGGGAGAAPGTSASVPFVDFGGNDVLDAVAGVTVPVQHANWCHKWLVHRRLRPEAYGGRVVRTKSGDADYPIPASLLDSQALAETVAQFGTGLLPQAYPEGAPLHPSYPAGHAGIAGAAVTVLKAYFDEDWVLPSPVVPAADGSTLEPVGATLTVGGELNKLASNVSIGRNWAGIHYRSDAADGLRLGEAVALGYLMDRARSYADSYEFTGFRLTTFDGERVRVTPDGVVPA